MNDFKNDLISFLNNPKDLRCKICGKQYTNVEYEWCKTCQINSLKANFTCWSSGNKKIDDFIQGMQSKINGHFDIVFEWISYNQFDDIKEIKEIDKTGFTTVHLAVWNEGPLYYNYYKQEWTKKSNKNVALKRLHNPQNIASEILNKIKGWNDNIKIYGISQDPDTKEYILVLERLEWKYFKKCFHKFINASNKWCKSCQIDSLKANFKNWTSGNEIIDDFIQGMQLNFDFNSHLFEWIPYNRFNNIREIGESGYTTVYSAMWKNGPLYHNHYKWELTRESNKNVILKCIYNSQNIANEFLNKVKEWDNNIKIYGISQNPYTKDYFVVFQDAYYEEYTNIKYKWCKPCQLDSLKANFTNWTSGNEKIDEFIQKIQLKIDEYNNYNYTVFEWIPYSQFNGIKEIGKDGSATVHSAMWKDGPLYHNKNEWTRLSNKIVALKCLYNSQVITNEFNGLLNEIKKYSNKFKIYGITQNPDTKDYILVLHFHEKYCVICSKKYKNVDHKWCKQCKIDFLKANFTNWTSGNKMIDDFIQEMQLQINNYNDIIFEWIPYNQFNDIKEMGKNSFATIYSAIWKDGSLHHNKNKCTRIPDKKVTLKCLCNSQNTANEFLKKVKEWNYDFKTCGISQNPDTNDYIIVCNYVPYNDEHCVICSKEYTDIKYKWCISCQIYCFKKEFINWTSGNEKIDCCIQEVQLNIDYPTDIVFEWIPYNQFSDIKEIGNGGFATVYSAIWRNGPLHYDSDRQEWTRESNKQVALKCLYNSQNITNGFLNEVKAYSIKKSDGILPIYGITQNPVTKDYIMVLNYAKGGNFDNWINKNYKNYFNWNNRIITLKNIIDGLGVIHQKQMVHRDFHTGNILFSYGYISNRPYISDMGLCGEVNNLDEVNIYGVMPYVAPEVLRRKPYTQAADIYSFGMIMYFVATGRQPFANIVHDHCLVLDICSGIRPEINEPEAPKCYIDLMKKCWDSNPDNRPSAEEVYKLIGQYNPSKQFIEAEEYWKANLSSYENGPSTIHPQAIYTSRLLNPFFLSKNIARSECLDCEIH